MKIYLFDTETGLYLGEDFADEAPQGGDLRVVPPGATTVSPPQVGPGQVLIFDPAAGRWEARNCRNAD